MNLKKSDKIIAIVGVLILIVAAVGIIVYTQSSKETKKTGDAENKTFYVTWEKDTGTVSAGADLYAGKKAPYTNTISVASLAGSILTRVEFKLSWVDDITYGILKKRGLDMLTAEIAYTGGGTLTDVSTGSGNHTFSFDVGDVPQDGSVEAKDISEAEQIVKENYMDKDEASFDVTVSVKTGERIFRILKFLKDKGNGFDLEITYDYYYAVVEDTSSPPEGESSADEQPSAHQSYMITNLVTRQ